MPDAQLSARALETALGAWRSSGPANAALADRIRLLVLDGRLPTDTRLPAERDLATRLALSRTTVTAAYRRLREAGYLLSRRGSGSVTRLPRRGPGPVSVSDDGILDLTRATLPPIEGIVEASRRAVDALPASLAHGGFDAVGTAALRAAIADRYRTRGMPTAAEQVMVTLGAQHAISLLSRTLLGRGDRALIETPTYPHAYEALRAAGARLVPVPVSTESGWDEAALLQALQHTSPTVAYLMPDFHNPTGRSMPMAMRERVLSAAARQGTALIADETTAELNIDRVGAFAPFGAASGARAGAAASTAILIGSVGKTLWGGFRVGWIRAEPALIRKLVAARAAGDLGTPVLEQLIVTQLLAEMDAILQRRRDQLRASRDSIRAQLNDRFPDWSVPEVDGGVAAWVNLGSPSSSRLALAARSQGLLITAGPRFGIDGAFERYLRIPIGYPAEEMARALDALEAAWLSVPRHPLPETAYLSDVV
ncbi:MAG: PLP-dependent aminotransferase family protein [Microbacteriaceae bacterium]